MNVYLFELKALRKSILGWCFTLCALVSVYLSLYPMFHDMNFDIAGLFSRFPPTLQSLFGMTGLDTGSFIGYLSFPVKLAAELAAIGGIVVGAFASAHDSRQKCADFLYSKPLAREKVLFAKLGAVVTGSFILLAVMTVFLLVMARILAPGEAMPFFSALASAAIPTLLFLLYAMLGMLLGILFPPMRGAAGLGIGMMFLFHIVFSIGKVISHDADSPLVRITVPICMFDRPLAASEGRLETPYLLLWAAEVAVLIAACFLTLRRRDIE